MAFNAVIAIVIMAIAITVIMTADRANHSTACGPDRCAGENAATIRYVGDGV